VTLSAELRAWIVPGLAGTIASIDARGYPQIVRVWAARPSVEADSIDLCVSADAASSFLEGLTGRARAALNLVEVLSYRSRQFKGSCQLLNEPIDFEWLRASRAAANTVFEAVGMGPDGFGHLLSHAADPANMLLLRLSVESVFDQSPRPGAGARL
jgi:hypothetical protein